MANLTITASLVAAVYKLRAFTLPSGVAVVAGQVVGLDANGKWELPLATTAPNANNQRWVAVGSADIGLPAEAVGPGSILDLGEALASLAFDAAVYLSDTAGTLADSAGTVSVIMGYVVPGWGGYTPTGAPAADKLLQLV